MKEIINEIIDGAATAESPISPPLEQLTWPGWDEGEPPPSEGIKRLLRAGINVLRYNKPAPPGRQLATMTPSAMAAFMLEREAPNREHSDAHGAAICDKMKQDEFVSQVGMVIVNGEGEVIDHAHRLRAQVAADKTYDLLVFMVDDPRAPDAINEARPATASDKLQALYKDAHGAAIYDRQTANVLTSAARIVVKLQNGTWRKGGKMMSVDIRKAVERFSPLLRELCADLPDVKRPIIPRHAMLVAMYAVVSTTPDLRSQIKDFINKLALGCRPEDGAVYDLERWLRTRKRLSTVHRYAVMARAWKAQLSGKRLYGIAFAGLKRTDLTPSFTD